jgi:hypothetical protein
VFSIMTSDLLSKHDPALTNLKPIALTKPSPSR